MTGDSFSFNQYNSVEDWGMMVVATDVLLPPKRRRKITIPGRSGAYDFGAKNWEERTIRLTCTLMRQMSKGEFREIVYALSKKGRLWLGGGCRRWSIDGTSPVGEPGSRA